jgi:hypothetical protein
MRADHRPHLPRDFRTGIVAGRRGRKPPMTKETEAARKAREAEEVSKMREETYKARMAKELQNTFGSERQRERNPNLEKQLKEWPPRAFKTAWHDPANNRYHVTGAFRSFAEAYNHPSGTHVIQTHGTSAEVEQHAREIEGLSSPSSASGSGGQGPAMAKGAAAGMLVAGPVGALVGAAIAGGGKRDERWHEMRPPKITPKTQQSEGPEIVYD